MDWEAVSMRATAPYYWTIAIHIQECGSTNQLGLWCSNQAHNHPNLPIPYSGFLSRAKTFSNFAFLLRFVKVVFAKNNLEWVPDTGDISRKLCQLCSHGVIVSTANDDLVCLFPACWFQIWMVHYRRLYLFRHPGLPIRRTGETDTRSVQDGRGKEPYTGLPIRWCVNECGELVTINLQKFSPRKSIYKQFVKVFTHEKNPLYGTIHLTNIYRLLPSPIYALLHCFLFSVFLFLITKVQWHHTLID